MSLKRLPARPARGLSLVELMIAMTLGLLLVLGVIQIFGASRASYSASMAVSQVQETGRFALEIVKPILRSAGSLGFCAGDLEIRSHLNTTCAADVNALYAPGRILIGWEAVGTGSTDTYPIATLVPTGVTANQWRSMQPGGGILSLPTVLLNQVVPGTDVLVLRSLEPVPNVTAVGNTPANAAAINLTAASTIAAGDLLLVTDCNNADLFQHNPAGNASVVTRNSSTCTNPGPGNRAPSGPGSVNWSTQYDNRMQLFRARMHAYYIGLDAVSGEPGLYRHDITTGVVSTARQELVRGVENMQLRYGLSLPGALGGDGQSVDHWLAADQMTDWGLVVAVHMSLLVRSTEGAGQPAQQTLNMAGTLVTHPNDSRMRKRFNATVALRNQVIVQ
jgi:type IV pilus assembly protein PilW